MWRAAGFVCIDKRRRCLDARFQVNTKDPSKAGGDGNNEIIRQHMWLVIKCRVTLHAVLRCCLQGEELLR